MNFETPEKRMRVTIPHPERFTELQKHMKVGGPQKLHVLADFDRTLTYGVIDGVKTPSIISMLRDGNHLSAEYAAAAHTLFNKYHPIEVDPAIPPAEKKRAMQEWWETHNALLIQSGLTRADLQDIVDHGHVKFREGVPEFLDFLHEHEIPLVILSAAGCGDAIQLFFKKIGRDYPNIKYVTNQFEWDASGRAIKTKGPIIHNMNKDETVLAEIPDVYRAIESRKNVILLGDSLSDLGMIEGFEYETLLKIGFLNFDYDKDRAAYEQQFDVVLEGDGDVEFVNDFIGSIV